MTTNTDNAELKILAEQINKTHAELKLWAVTSPATIGKKLLEAYECFPADVFERRRGQFFRSGWHRWLKEQGIDPEVAARLMRIARSPAREYDDENAGKVVERIANALARLGEEEAS